MSLPATTPQLCTCAAAAGALSHWAYFMHGEHHLQAPWLLSLSVALPVLIHLGLWKFAALEAVQGGILTAELVSSYFVALWTSILVYRVFFHRLRGFPGPFMAKTSKLWHVWKLAPRSDNYKQLHELHKQYGDYVRTGPNEVSIFNAEAFPAIIGPGSKCSKAPWYDATYPIRSLHTTRDKGAHDERRRIWDRGFNAKALRTYEDRIMTHSKDLKQQIGKRSGQPISATEWFHFYGFDVMGDIAFGKSFDMVQTGKSHFALDLLREGMRPLGILGPVPWAFRILTSIPGLGSGFKTFVSWCTDQIEKRKKIQMEVPDVMSWLIDASEKAEKGHRLANQTLLRSDSRLIIVAGSDTTASTLTYLFYQLARNAAQQDKLRQELASFQEADGSFSFKSLQGAEHLNGVINEVLRLHPAVPSGVLRLTPPGGIYIGETFIPGSTTIVAPNYTVARLESCYEKGNEFIPERWYSKPEMIKNKAAFAPFSMGPFSCVGKQIALMELRMVVAMLVMQFDICFAPGEDGSALLNDSMDFFTISTANLSLVFTERASSA